MELNTLNSNAATYYLSIDKRVATQSLHSGVYKVVVYKGNAIETISTITILNNK